MDDDPWADTPREEAPDGLSQDVQAAKAGASTSLHGGDEVQGDDIVADDGLDDFDDFDDTLIAPTIQGGEDDAFGDFGDFEAGDQGHAGINVEPPVQAVLEVLRALSLRPVPPRSEILSQITDLLSPLSPDPSSTTHVLTDEAARMKGGLGQVMVAESSRDVYAQLTTAPMLKPLDWTRSRSRREHLISMGVPVNLDEVDSHRISTLPPLRITTMPPPTAPPLRPASTDGHSLKSKLKLRESSPAAGPVSAGPRMSLSAGPPRTSNSGVEGGNSAEVRHGLGVKPEIDTSRAEELCGLEEDQLSLLPLPRLKKIQEDLASISASASAQLAWFLQLKDAQNHDSATYNGMISELIANAQKAKTAQVATGGGVFRRASTKARPVSVSGSSTPRRVGSPGTFQ